MKNLLFLIAPFVFGLASCSSDAGKNIPIETKDTIAAKENFEKGKVIDKINALNDPTHSYALYLPSNYSPEKAYPVIYIFDAHADGKLPLSKYKELAEKYGYILAGSNNSKNGLSWEETQKIANNLFSDTHERLSIDATRMYLMGFSGGARIANSLCVANGGFSGVICCGAASPAVASNDPRSNYTFLGICGNEDFNYIEMRKYDMVDLIGRPVKHAFIEFDGKHEWPSADIIREGFVWFELGAMRKNPKLKDPEFIKEELFVYSERIATAQKEKNTMELYEQVRRTINFFDGLTDLKYYHGIYNPLRQNAEVDASLKTEEVVWKKEDEMKAFYGEAFQTKNLAWWKQEAASLKKKTKKPEEALMNKRLLDYLSLVAYMQTTNSIQQQNLPASKMFSDIYLVIDPTNPEAHYLSAELLAIDGKKTEAVQSLNEALKNGFKDAERMENDKSLQPLKDSEEFKEVLSKVKTAANS